MYNIVLLKTIFYEYQNKNHKINTSFIIWSFGLNETGIDFMTFHFYVRGKLSLNNFLSGDAAAGSGKVVVDENDPRVLILKKLSLVVEGRPDVSMDLTENLEQIKTKKFTLKVGLDILNIFFFLCHD